ncbi:TPA: hypothetical protein ACIJU4_000378 [Klebsiella pneumoniae]|uniref:Uncharacterized protein n=2 Tax=Klebsiella pneumoniae complex TaxID=3390273 RepID=A0A8B4UVT0_KLEPN|nr:MULTISPECIES: hypothetical protein [Klebsiella/Raoultella group]MDU6064050.1 hypothetical protein [Anaerococcus sp.]DAI84179.1 MAG TPA: hypothetical protein [Bacteriophage sp.]EIV9269160.1 hypothetical protein [Klebsiella pneumoniae]EIY2358722.1 hypothetical protein [Klebsiella pneumoniae]EJK8809904.1 hypothetical protein [Klebsiella pneumoniae]
MSSDEKIAILEDRIKKIEGVTTHLLIRSELTMCIVSAMIGADVISRDGVKEMINKIDLSEFQAPAITEAERKIILQLVDRVEVV